MMNKKIAEYFDGLQVDLIHISQAFAVDNKSPQIEPVHIFRALLHKSVGLVNYIEDSLDEDYYYLIDWCDIHIQQCEKSPYPMKKTEFSRDSQTVIKEAISLEEQYGTESHKLEFLLAALVSPGVGFSSEQLKTMPLSREKVLSSISKNVKSAVNFSINLRINEVLPTPVSPITRAFALSFRANVSISKRRSFSMPIISKSLSTSNNELQ